MKRILLIAASAFFIQICYAQTDSVYFGQTPPGDTAVMFAPGIISRTDRLESKIIFSPDSNDCYIQIFTPDYDTSKIYYTKRLNNTWSEQVEASFLVGNKVEAPFLSVDGNRLYYAYKNADNTYDIRMVEHTAVGWGESQLLPTPIYSSSNEIGYSETVDSFVYFTSNRTGGSGEYDIWCKRPSSGQVENLGKTMNSSGFETGPCISPDGSYLIFGSDRGNFGGDHLYISFIKGNNEWTTPMDMNRSGAQININNVHQMGASLSPDGKFLFFARHSNFTDMDIYWVRVDKAIDSMKFLSGITKVVNHALEQKIGLFPNPTTGQFTISFGTSPAHEALIEIFNLQGKLVFSEIFHNTSTETIDIKDFPKGLYVVKVLIEGENFSKKVCLE